MQVAAYRPLGDDAPLAGSIGHGFARWLAVDRQAHPRRGRRPAAQGDAALGIVVDGVDGELGTAAGARLLQDAGGAAAARDAQGQRLAGVAGGTAGDVLARLGNDHQNFLGRPDGRRAAHPHLQIESMTAGRQRRLRHEHPFAAAVGGGLAQRPLAIPQNHLCARLRPAGDDRIALGIDAHDIEARQRCCGQGRGGFGRHRRGNGRGRGRAWCLLCLTRLQQVDDDRDDDGEQARPGDNGGLEEPAVGIGMDGPHGHFRKPSTITRHVQCYRRAE